MKVERRHLGVCFVRYKMWRLGCYPKIFDGPSGTLQVQTQSYMKQYKWSVLRKSMHVRLNWVEFVISLPHRVQCLSGLRPSLSPKLIESPTLKRKEILRESICKEGHRQIRVRPSFYGHTGDQGCRFVLLQIKEGYRTNPLPPWVSGSFGQFPEPTRSVSRVWLQTGVPFRTTVS